MQSVPKCERHLRGGAKEERKVLSLTKKAPLKTMAKKRNQLALQVARKEKKVAETCPSKQGSGKVVDKKPLCELFWQEQKKNMTEKGKGDDGICP